VRRLILFGV
jgi:hypothetical protein